MPTEPRSTSRFERLPLWQRTAALVLTVLAIGIVLLLAAEAAVRVRERIKYGYLWGIEDTYKLDPVSGLRIPIPNSHFGPIAINSFGFRSPEIAKEKPSGRLRIAFLGGSVTYCAEDSSNQATWPYLVWKALHRRWPSLDLDFINAGVPGYTSDTLRRVLDLRLAQFKPDVIVLETGNDLSMDARALATEHGAYTPTQEQRPSWLSRYSLLAFLIEKNLMIRHLQQEAEAPTGKFTPDSRQLAGRLRGELVPLVEASQKTAPLVAILTNAPRLRAGQNAEQRRAAAETSLYYMPYMSIDGLLEGSETSNQVIRAVAREQGALLIGDENAIPGDSADYADSSHLTDAGSRAMARRVTAALEGSAAFVRLVEAKQSAAHPRSAARN